MRSQLLHTTRVGTHQLLSPILLHLAILPDTDYHCSLAHFFERLQQFWLPITPVRPLPDRFVGDVWRDINDIIDLRIGELANQTTP